MTTLEVDENDRIWWVELGAGSPDVAYFDLNDDAMREINGSDWERLAPEVKFSYLAKRKLKELQAFQARRDGEVTIHAQIPAASSQIFTL